MSTQINYTHFLVKDRTQTVSNSGITIENCYYDDFDIVEEVGKETSHDIFTDYAKGCESGSPIYLFWEEDRLMIEKGTENEHPYVKVKEGVFIIEINRERKELIEIALNCHGDEIWRYGETSLETGDESFHKFTLEEVLGHDKLMQNILWHNTNLLSQIGWNEDVARLIEENEEFQNLEFARKYKTLESLQKDFGCSEDEATHEIWMGGEGEQDIYLNIK